MELLRLLKNAVGLCKPLLNKFKHFLKQVSEYENMKVTK